MFRLSRTPIKLEVLTQVKDEIFYHDYLATVDTDDRHAAVLTYPSISVRQLNIPVHSNDIVPSNGKDVPHPDILDIKLEPRELFKEIPKPTFDGTLSPESKSVTPAT